MSTNHTIDNCEICNLHEEHYVKYIVTRKAFKFDKQFNRDTQYLCKYRGYVEGIDNTKNDNKILLFRKPARSL